MSRLSRFELWCFWSAWVRVPVMTLVSLSQLLFHCFKKMPDPLLVCHMLTWVEERWVNFGGIPLFMVIFQNLFHCRSLHQRYRHPSRQRSHQLRLPQALRDIPTSHRKIRPLWPPRSGHQPGHAWGSQESLLDRAAASHWDSSSAKWSGDRQEFVRRRVPDARRRWWQEEADTTRFV